MTEGHVFKICSSAEWRSSLERGRIVWSPDDLRDGFVHLSTGPQLAGTLKRHFQGRSDLVLVAFRTVDLGDALKWESSRGGQLFPHVYGDLPTEASCGAAPIGPLADGTYQLPSPLPGNDLP